MGLHGQAVQPRSGRHGHKEAPAHTALTLPGIDGWCQRWHERAPRWRHRSEGGFDRDRYTVAPVKETTARAFVERHHYSASWPAARLRYGLYDHLQAGDRLVGVVVFGVPMQKQVLTGPFPNLVPYDESIELSRLVLLDAVPANAESWFSARAFRMAAEHGVRGVVAFSDPMPRSRITPAGGVEQFMPGHTGVVYQALSADYLGRGTPRTLLLLPDGSVLAARSAAKVTGGEKGMDGVVSRLVGLAGAHGVTLPPFKPDTRRDWWLNRSLAALDARRVRHRGNHRYAFRIGRTRGERTRAVIGMTKLPYPKHRDPAR